MLASVPEPDDHDGVARVVDPIPDDISPTTERHDEFSVTGFGRRTPALRQIAQRSGCREQRINGSLRQLLAMRRKELPKPIEIGSRARQEDDLHGSGGGSSFGVPQLLAHASAAASGIDSPVRLYSA